MNNLRDYKAWIQSKAEDIAREHYETEYHDLPEEEQRTVYNLATEAYKDAYFDSIDALTDYIQESAL